MLCNFKRFRPILAQNTVFLLQGWAMCQYLPTGEFKFLPTWQMEEILRTRPDADYGFFLEVDLRCPVHLHDKLNDFPPAPSNTRPSKLSPFQREMLRENLRSSHPNWDDQRLDEEIGKESTSEKLIASLEDKKNYVCHYRLLQKYVELGMEVNLIQNVKLSKAQRYTSQTYIFNKLM